MPLESQLARADAFVLLGTATAGDVPRFLTETGKPVFSAAIVPEAGQTVHLEGPLIAFAGIGNPAKFFETLGELGARVVETAAFADHHPFSADDAKSLIARASAAGARLVTTEKDLARLKGVPHLSELAGLSAALKIGVHFTGSDAGRMRQLLSAATKR